MFSTITFLFLVLAALFVLFTNRQRVGLVVVGIALLCNLISLLLYYLSPALSRVNVVVATREITIYLLLITTFIFVKKFRVPFGHLLDKAYVLVFLLFLMMIVISVPGNGISALLMGRELIFPLATYFFFRFINLNEKQTAAIIRFVITLAVVTSSVGIIEFFYLNFINHNFWNQIQVSGYLAQKYGSFEGDYPLSWVNYLNIFFGLPPGLRTIGLMLDPLATGHFLACSFTVVFYWIRSRFKYILLTIIGLGVVFTFSKAALLICFIAISSCTFLLHNKGLRIVGILFLVVSVILAGVLLLSTGDDSFTHFGSFKTGLAALLKHPLGNGVGSTGYFAILTTGQGTIEVIDTTFSVYVYQMGIIGLLALIVITWVPLLVLLQRIRYARQLYHHKSLTPICLALFISYSLLAFSSAAAFTAVPVFIPMMLLAVNQIEFIAVKKRRYLRDTPSTSDQFARLQVS
jgi:hypothetical protein